MAAYPTKTDKETMNPTAAQKQGDAPSPRKNSRSQKKNYRNKHNGENKNAAKLTPPETPTEVSAEKAEVANSSATKTPEKPKAPVVPAAVGVEDKNQPATATAFEIGWMFVQQYYTFMNQNPKRLHCFYKAKSAMVRGNESDDLITFYGQKGIHQRIMELNYNNCKVLISNVDVQASLFGSIVIMVLGELSNNDEPTQRFAQTFVLCEQEHGFFILNDIFRFLKDTNNSDVQGVGFVGVELEDGEFKVVNLPEKDTLQSNGSGLEKSSDASEVASLKAEPATPAEEIPIEPLVPAVKDSEASEKKDTSEVPSQEVTPVNACNAPSTDDLKKMAAAIPKAQSEDKVKDAETPPAKTAEKADVKPMTQSKVPRTSVPQDAKVSSSSKGTWAHLAGSGHMSSSESTEPKTPQLQESFSKGGQVASHRSQPPKESPKDYIHLNSICIRGMKDPLNKQLVREVFSSFGPIKSIDAGSRLVFVEYEDADACVKALAGSVQLVGDEKVVVEPRRAKGSNRSNGKSRGFSGPRKGNGSRTTEGSNSTRQSRQGSSRPSAAATN